MMGWGLMGGGQWKWVMIWNAMGDGRRWVGGNS